MDNFFPAGSKQLDSKYFFSDAWYFLYEGNISPPKSLREAGEMLGKWFRADEDSFELL